LQVRPDEGRGRRGAPVAPGTGRERARWYGESLRPSAGPPFRSWSSAMGLILSIDVGTTNLKAALVDETGRLDGEAKSINIRIEGDATGRAEHDPAKLQRAMLEACRLAVGPRGREVEKLSLTSYQFGLVLVDRDGNPLTNISTFVDTTAQAHHVRFLEAIGDVDQMYLRTGCPPIFQYPVNRLHRLTSQNPSLASRTARVLDSKAFLMHALTGEYVTDYSTANSLGCLDISGEWDRAIIAAVGFEPAQFPRVLNGFVDSVALKQSICGELGLLPDTVVAAGLYDGAALAAALTGFEPQLAVGNFGTSGMFRVPTPSPVHDLAGGLIQSCLLKPGTFFTGSGINNCTIATNLLLNVLGLELDYLRGGALSVPGSNNVMTFPYFTGERDKVIGNIGTGMVVGLGVATTRDDLARSFLEGVAFSFLLVKQKLDPGQQIRELRLGGGGTGNRPWMQIMADALNLPIRLAPDPEMGIVGAASLARHGEGSDLLQSSRRMMRDAPVIEPIAANVAIYQEVAGRYFDVRESLREPLLARLGLSPLRTLAARAGARVLPLVREMQHGIR
jgi:gluconokinase